MTLYNLTLTDNDLSEQFNIGYFTTRELAEATARDYLNSVRGFCEYNCGCSITEKTVVGSKSPVDVFIVFGWNGYESDIVESDLYTTEALARRSLAEMRSEYDREEWCVDRFRVDECRWQEGFVRV